MNRREWNQGLGVVTRALESMRDNITEFEEPTVAWCCAQGAIASVLALLGMLSDCGYPGDDKTPTVEVERCERCAQPLYNGQCENEQCELGPEQEVTRR